MTRGAAGVLAAAVIAVVGTSQAATLGTVTPKSLAAGTTSVAPLCTMSTLGISVQVGYRASRYEIYQLTFSSIPTGCQGKPFIAQFVDGTTNASLGSTTGTLPSATSGTVTVPAGTNPSLNDVASTIQVVLYASG